LQGARYFVKDNLLHVKTKTAILSIENLTQEALPNLREALQKHSGVEEMDFNLERRVAVVEFDPEQTNVEKLMYAILQAGFRLT